jgi:uncharacterized sulfatase
MDRRQFIRTSTLAATAGARGVAMSQERRPNILFCLSDDQSWCDVSALGHPVVRTPAFDRVAAEGVLFTHSFCSAPSCTPSRAAVLTGRNFWELDESANLWSTLSTRFAAYPDLLAEAGYHVGLMKKGWGPGDFRPGGWTRNPAGPAYASFEEFLAARPEGRPFCFWFGSLDPHRPYEVGSGLAAGKRLEDVRVPPFLPDAPEVRSDLLDYYVEIERYDRDCGAMIGFLEERGELDNTLIVITSDNGLPFPRAKANLYDWGTRMPLAVRWPERVPAGRRVEDLVSHIDFAPTFLEAAGLQPPAEMTGRSLLDVLTSSQDGRVDPTRDRAFTGRERHCRHHDGRGYPSRAIRTPEFLYVWNLLPDRWPGGDPEEFIDIDAGPTKAYVLDHRDEPQVAPCYEMACGKRPEEELYDLREDPDQLRNVADSPESAATRAALRAALEARMRETGDRRAVGGAELWDTAAYYGGPVKPH